MVRALYAEFTALPGREAALAAKVAGLTEAVRAEPGNLAFVAYTLESDPRRWFVYEVYADEAAFRTHLTAPHSAAFNSDLADYIEGAGSALTRLTPST